MARVARTPKTTRPAAKGRKQSRRPVATTAKTRTKAKGPATTRTAATSKGAGIALPPTKVSKDELRARIEKLKRVNAALRAKSRDAVREAKTAAARIAELEDQVAWRDEQLAAQVAAVGHGQASSLPRGDWRAQRGEIDPGDDRAPPEVAVEETAQPNPEAETAPENLDEHPRGQ
jgi:hypothetical protein